MTTDQALESEAARQDRALANAGGPTRVLSGSTFIDPPVAAEHPFLRPASQPGEIGRLGGYRVLRLLGAGGMGYVFQAEDIALRRPVALKVMKPEVSRDPESWQRSLREARIMAAIKHEHLVTIYQAGEESGVFYLAMELLEGESLGKRLDRVGQAGAAEILRLGREIARGLAVVHEQGLIHRDIKPQNIWLQAPHDRVKILDFGLARSVHDDHEPGAIMGTPAFMSPEQAAGEAIDPRSDLFSLGAVLYCLCTGRRPFQAEHTMAVLTALTTATPPPVHELNPTLPRALSDLVTQLLAKDRGERPDSAAAVLRRLEQIEAAQAPKPTALTDQRRLAFGAFLAIVSVCWAFSASDAPVAPTSQEETAVIPGEAGVAYLSDLTPLAAEHWPFDPGPLKGKGKGPSSNSPVQIQGQRSPHGIFMHPPGLAAPGEPASISYRLDRQYDRFKAEVSLNDGPPASIQAMTFSVYGDRELLWQSEPVQTQDDTQAIDIAVDHVDVLKIEVDCEVARGAHAVWIEPRLTK